MEPEPRPILHPQYGQPIELANVCVSPNQAVPFGGEGEEGGDEWQDGQPAQAKPRRDLPLPGIGHSKYQPKIGRKGDTDVLALAPKYLARQIGGHNLKGIAERPDSNHGRNQRQRGRAIYTAARPNV